jgi:hypothetical protein
MKENDMNDLKWIEEAMNLIVGKPLSLTLFGVWLTAKQMGRVIAWVQRRWEQLERVM